MIYIGNDIVDLTDPDNIGKSGDSRFLRRVFSETEQNCIVTAAAPDTMLWALWAAKETAYKAARKADVTAVFLPRLFHVVLAVDDKGQADSGMVHTPYCPVAVRLYTAADYVHCIGATPLPGMLDRVVRDIERLAPTASNHDTSTAVRLLARRNLAGLLNVPEEKIDIRRWIDIWGPPVPYIDGRPLPYDLSLSHDGAFVACAMVSYPEGWAQF